MVEAAYLYFCISRLVLAGSSQICTLTNSRCCVSKRGFVVSLLLYGKRGLRARLLINKLSSVQFINFTIQEYKMNAIRPMGDGGLTRKEQSSKAFGHQH